MQLQRRSAFLHWQQRATDNFGECNFEGDSQGGPIPAGQYTITHLPGQAPGTWFLDPGLSSRALYRLSELTRQNLGFSFWRGGFNIHLPGSVSHGCVSAPSANNPGSNVGNSIVTF